jgi:glycosyltransferase involved in cell wall biosynthesis
MTGRLDDLNGIPVLLAAMPLLSDVSISLHIAGSGPLESLVRAAAEADRRIKFEGFLAHQQVLDLQRRVDLLLCVRPTKTMNTKYFFPSKLLEYLASGTPVLSTKTGHVESEFGAFCYMLDDETPGGLAAALRHIMALPAQHRSDLARRARNYMLEEKTWKMQRAKIGRYAASLL